MAGLGRRLTQLLLVEEIRTLAALVRFFCFRVLMGRIESFTNESDAIGGNALVHNRNSIFRSVMKGQRGNILVRPLTVIPRVRLNLPDSRILAIGPRSESELLGLLANGFRWKNIRGLDLFSYSPKIDVGDMHALPYEDNTFDIVTASRVLGYSEDQPKAAAEMIRVTKPGGVIAVNAGSQRNRASAQNIDRMRKLGYRPGAEKTVYALPDLLELFGNSVDQIYHMNDPAKEPEGQRGSIVAIFSIRK